MTTSTGVLEPAVDEDVRRSAPPAATDGTCSGLVRALGVDTAGAASPLRSWLLLEHDAPWGADVRDRAYAAALGEAGWTHLQQLWEREQLRPLVVRRPGRRRSAATDATLVVGAARDGRSWLERLPARALPAVDLAALAAGEPGHGEPLDGPLFAVCTNGSVDRCCAVRGRPLVAALAAEHPERTWEVTHVGGCRFAANLLVLPDAALHGGLTPERGLAVAAQAMRGRVDPADLRGLAGASAASAAAEVELRRRLDLRGPADVRLLRTQQQDRPGAAAADTEVLLEVGGRRWRAVVRTEVLGPHTTVCDGTAVREAPLVTRLEPA